MVSESHSFFVPRSISHIRISELQPSPDLAVALRRLHLKTFGDLAGICLRHFLRVNVAGARLFVEIQELAQQARQMGVTVSFDESRKSPFHSGPVSDMASLNQLSASAILKPEKTCGRPFAALPVAAKLRRTNKPRQARHSKKPHEQCSIPMVRQPLDNPSGSTLNSTAASPDLTRSQTIFIPEEARGMPLARCTLSVRLGHVFAAAGIRLAGQLHGMAISDFLSFRNCGRKTITEIQGLVLKIQQGHRFPTVSDATAAPQDQSLVKGPDALFVPPNVRPICPFDLPLSVRLENTLRKRKIARLGELDGVSISELHAIKNVGRKTIEELIRLVRRAANGEFVGGTDANVPWNAAEFVRTVDGLISQLRVRDREIFLARLGAKSGKALTLEEVGSQFGLTRERIRQVGRDALRRIEKIGSLRLRAYLNHIANACNESVCPLTPELLAHWLGDGPRTCQFPPIFYVRLAGELSVGLPAWPDGQVPSSVHQHEHDQLVSWLETVIRSRAGKTSLQDAYAIAKDQPARSHITPAEFLSALKATKRLKVQFTAPGAGEILPPRLLVADVARCILGSSGAPLTPEAILARAAERFGANLPAWEPRALAGSLTEEKGFLLLGPRSYGLSDHILLPKDLWCQARADFREVLKQASHPVSTVEVVNSHRFAWTTQTNTYELATILRGDNCFIDLGKFLFALAEWGIEERDFIKDLIPKVLAEAAKPLTGTQVFERLQQLRSLSPTSIASHLRKNPKVRDYGFGHYGLKSWGDAVKANIVEDADSVERIIRRAAPPLTFARLCDILDIPPSSALAGTLWQTSAAMSEVLRIPDERSDNTRLIHRTCRLERALVATAREVNRPLPLYEFAWELSERFGPLFNAKSQNDIRHTLEQCPMFLRNAAGQFILDIHLEQLGLDADAIRSACAEILTQSNEIIGCEDLLERLDADGRSWEELSPDILTSLLRDDPMFQEIGRDRFKLKSCKH